METLDSLRVALNNLDLELSRLYDERLQLVAQIAAIKEHSDLPVRNEAVEAEKLVMLREATASADETYLKAKEGFFQYLMEVSRDFQCALRTHCALRTAASTAPGTASALVPATSPAPRPVSAERKKIELYTDGACSGNPGPGGWGCILRYMDETGVLHESAHSQGYQKTTNNRMELLGVINGLAFLKEPCCVDVFTDSRYIVDAFQKGWVRKWKANDWYRDEKRKELAKNIDLWQQLEALMARHQVQYHWVKGHADNPLNTRCDQLAVAASHQTSSQIRDDAFENG